MRFPPGQTRDTQGRLIAYLYVGEECINECFLIPGGQRLKHWKSGEEFVIVGDRTNVLKQRACVAKITAVHELNRPGISGDSLS